MWRTQPQRYSLTNSSSYVTPFKSMARMLPDRNTRGQGCSLFTATPTTFSRKEPMQPTRQAPQGSVPPTGQGEGLPRPFFQQREAHPRPPPPFRFFAPVTSKTTPDHIVTLVVTQSATAPHHCTAPLPTAPQCPTSRSPAEASTVQIC